MSETYEVMLTGGHPNSLGRTEEVVAIVLDIPETLEDLFLCYRSQDAVVRLRVSSALKRIEKARHVLVVPLIDRLISEVGKLEQASAQWSLAELFDSLAGDMTGTQRHGALSIMKRNIESHTDWIVINHTMQTLANWAESDSDLKTWLLPHLKRHAGDPRKSIAKRANRILGAFAAEKT